MTQFPTYHDPSAANIPPDVVAAIEEQCGLPFAEAVEKYGGRPFLCDGRYYAFANPPGCGREHFAAVAEVYRSLLNRQERARMVTDAKAAPVKPTRRPRRSSISKMIAQAEKASGKPVTSITTPDGMTLRFGEPEPGALKNPWFADLDKAKQQ